MLASRSWRPRTGSPAASELVGPEVPRLERVVGLARPGRERRRPRWRRSPSAGCGGRAATSRRRSPRRPSAPRRRGRRRACGTGCAACAGSRRPGGSTAWRNAPPLRHAVSTATHRRRRLGNVPGVPVARRRLFAGLVDDAALFPPGNAPMAEALAEHARHRSASYAGLVGPFLCPASRARRAARRPCRADQPWRCPSSSTPARPSRRGRCGAARRRRSHHAGGRRGAARAARPRRRRPSAPTLRRLPSVTGLPRGRPERRRAVAGPASRPRRLAGRPSSGPAAPTPEAFPTEQRGGRLPGRRRRARAAVQVTAGLHHAVRHTEPETGFEHHGFLNVLVATADALAARGARRHRRQPRRTRRATGSSTGARRGPSWTARPSAGRSGPSAAAASPNRSTTWPPSACSAAGDHVTLAGRPRGLAVPAAEPALRRVLHGRTSSPGWASPIGDDVLDLAPAGRRRGPRRRSRVRAPPSTRSWRWADRPGAPCGRG